MIGARTLGRFGQQGRQIDVGLKGVGEAVEQGVPLAGVVGLVFIQGRQLAPLTQLVQPAPAPGAVLENAVQIGAGHHTPLGA